jgi:TIGR03009 family protein
MIWFVVALLALFSSLAAQPPAAPQGNPPPLDSRIEQLLAQWEKEAAQTQSLWVKLKQTRSNPVFANAPAEVKQGEAKFLKRPDGTMAARIDLKDPQNPNNFDLIIFTGVAIYQFRPQEKVIHIITIPPQQAGKGPDDGPLPFLFGMKADVAKKRYHFTLLKNKTPVDEKWYWRLQVVPNFERDKQDFAQAELAVLKENTQAVPKDMPRLIAYMEPNKVLVTWDILELQRNPLGKVAAIDFAKPDLPKGWREELEQAVVPPQPGGQPRVIRNQKPN